MTQDVVTASIRINATPEEVFPYLIDPELLMTWLATSAETSPEPGGAFAISVGDQKVRGTYVSPPHRVVFTWGLPDNAVIPVGSSTVEIFLTADGNDTIVDLTHRDLPASEQPSHQEGWEMCLAKLAESARS